MFADPDLGGLVYAMQSKATNRLMLKVLTLLLLVTIEEVQCREGSDGLTFDVIGTTPRAPMMRRYLNGFFLLPHPLNVS